MTNNLFVNKSCINKENNCNYIKPYSNLDYSNLQIGKDNKDQFNIQYNKTCSSNNGLQIDTCNIDLNAEDLSKLTENEIIYFNNFKRNYPYAKIIHKLSDTNEKVIEKIEFHKQKLEEENNDPNNTTNNNIVNLTPYMLCKIKKSALKKDPNNTNIAYVDFFLPDNYDNNCSNDIVSLENIVGSNNKELTKEYSYYDDLSVISSIESNIFSVVKSYILKYKTVNHPLTNNDYNNRLIHIASKFNNIRVLNFIIALKGDLNIKNKMGDTPAHIAGENNNIDALNILIKNGANIKLENNMGQSIAFNIVKNKNLDLLNFVYNNGINIHSKDKDGNNLIHYSLLTNIDFDIIRFLINKKVSLQEKNNDRMLPIQYINEKIESEEVKNNHDMLLILSSIQSYIYKHTNVEKYKYELVNVSENIVEYPVEFDTMVCYRNTLSETELNGNNKNNNENKYEIIDADNENDCINKGGRVSNYDINNDNVSFQYLNDKQSTIDNINSDELYLDKKGYFKDGINYNTTSVNDLNNIETFNNIKNNYNNNRYNEGVKENNELKCRRKALIISILILLTIIIMVYFK
jgi:hypothetical protein